MFGIADNHEFLTAIGIENAPNRDEIVTDLEKVVQNKLTIKLSERLTAEQLEEYSSIEDEEQAASWLDKNLPDFPKLVTEALSEMKEEILSVKASAVGRSDDNVGTEKGEIVTLTDNREYVCLDVITPEDGKKYLYLMTTSKPINFCFAEETYVKDAVQLRIIGSKEEKHKLFDLLKVDSQTNTNQGPQHA